MTLGKGSCILTVQAESCGIQSMTECAGGSVLEGGEGACWREGRERTGGSVHACTLTK